MKRAVPIVVMLLALVLSRDASAQGFISPFIGTTLTSPSTDSDKSQMGFGVSFGTLGRIVGFETELAYFPEILDNDAEGLSKSKGITLGADTLIGPTVGPVKVYGAFGFGNLHLNVTSLSSIIVPDAESISNNFFTFNVGGGAAVSFAPHLGVRGDLRYFKAYGFDLDDFEGVGLQLDHFNFWRGTAGLLLKF
jgi:opacity protein-like surface antigen